MKYLTSHSWSGAHQFYLHFTKARSRASWVGSWKQAKVGDVLLWDWYGKGEFGHVSIISRKATSSWKSVQYAQHSGEHQYRELVKSLPEAKKKYPNMRLYVIRVSW